MLARARARRCPRRWFRKAPRPARVLVEYESAPLEDILRGMMRWSTNLTAEVVGLSATQAGGVRPTTLAESGPKWRHGCATGWVRVRRVRRSFGTGRGQPVASERHDPGAGRGGPDGLLRGLMRDIPCSTMPETGSRPPIRDRGQDGHAELRVDAGGLRAGPIRAHAGVFGVLRRSRPAGSPDARADGTSAGRTDLQSPGETPATGPAAPLGGDVRLERHVPRPRPAFDGGGVQPVDVELVAQFLEEPQLGLLESPSAAATSQASA
jgi:hypothetical protein